MDATPAAARRDLGMVSCVCIGLTTIVGGGIFALPPVLAGSLGPLAFVAFAGAAVVVAAIGLMTAEAAGTTDAPGGAYQYARAAFGPWAGFGVAWLAWINTILAWTGISLALVKILDLVAPGLGSGAWGQAIATAEIALFGIVNAFGARPGAGLSNVLTFAKLVPLVLFVAVGLLAFDATRFEGGGATLAAAGAGGFGVAVYRCIFAAGGFENIGVIAGDVRDPQRRIPRAVLLAIAASSALYALVQLAAASASADLAGVVPKGQPGTLALPLAAREAGERLVSSGFGALFERIVLVGAAVSMIGFCSGIAFVSPRYLFAMASDGFVPRALVRTSARGTPVFAILAATAVAIALVWAVDWLTLLDANVLFSLVQHATTVCAAWRLRRLVAREGRFIAPGGPLVPLLALGLIAAVCGFAFFPPPGSDIHAISTNHFRALGIVLACGFGIAFVSREKWGLTPFPGHETSAYAGARAHDSRVTDRNPGVTKASSRLRVVLAVAGVEIVLFGAYWLGTGVLGTIAGRIVVCILARALSVAWRPIRERIRCAPWQVSLAVVAPATGAMTWGAIQNAPRMLAYAIVHRSGGIAFAVGMVPFFIVGMSALLFGVSEGTAAVIRHLMPRESGRVPLLPRARASDAPENR